MATCVCMAESLPCSSEIATILFIGYILIQKFKVWKIKKDFTVEKKKMSTVFLQ